MAITYLDDEPKSKVTYLEDTPKEIIKSQGVQPQNILGQTFNVPGAAIRSLIQGTGYAKGATNPDSIPTFQQQSLNAPISNRPDQPVQNFAKGFLRDTVGYVADTVTNPANILATLAGGPATSMIGKTSVGGAVGNFINKSRTVNNLSGVTPNQLIQKAEKLATEVLNPKTSELATALEKGDQLKAITEATKIMKKNQDFNEMVGQFDTVIKDNFTRRNEILKSKNFNINGDQYTAPLKHEIINQEKLGASPADILQMKQVLGEEQAFLAKNGGKIDRLTGQAKKEFLQDKTDGLLVSTDKGKKVYSQPARAQALNLLRAGLKDSVEGGDKEVASLNSTYEGLKRARRLAAEKAALAQKAIPQGFLQGIVSRFSTNPETIAGNVARDVFNQSHKLSTKTGKIEELIRRANKLTP